MIRSVLDRNVIVQLESLQASLYSYKWKLFISSDTINLQPGNVAQKRPELSKLRSLVRYPDGKYWRW